MSPGIHTERLRRVRNQIVADPEHFGMDDWARPMFGADGAYCGTAHCIGGLAALDAGFIAVRQAPHPGRGVWYDITAASPVERYPYDQGRFAEALNLIPDEADRLFSVERWPQPFYVEYALARSPKERAELTARRIDLFIRTRGRE